MSKISTYDVVPVPKLADKLIGTSVGGEIEDVTYNFTLQELLDLYIPLMPANNLQGILDFGNTATQDINLFGTITTTYIDVTDTASFLNTYFVGETHVQGGLFDSTESIGTAGQVLTSTGEFVEWVTLPPIFTPNLQQVLGIGNTSDIGIILDAGLEALDVNTDTATINTNITIDGTLTDSDASVGSANQVLSSTVTGVKWVSLPVYSAMSPLFFDSATGVFSIQQAASYQAGYLSAADWTTFNGKQNAGNYITALTGEATASGPGAASVILTNSAVISKVLTGFNPTAGTINASDSILTAFGKAQSQINALVGGVQYKGTWNASTNVPTLQSSVGVQGNYYIVSVAGNTNLNGITDWQVGDWAIFSETTWQKVDNTESVTSVNGFTGAVSLTTDNIPEGSVNQYFTQSRARGSLSFVSGSGAYNNLTGVITIPTNTNELTNGANFITLGSLSASSPLSYNNTTGAFTIQVATALQNGYLSATDWSAFNSKQNYLNGTGLVKSTAGTITYITDNSGNWNTAYDRSIVSAAVTGTTTKTLTLTEQDGNTIQASWTDLDTGLTSVGVSMPSAFSVANSPLTANGTIAITGAGTTLQYVRGDGSLATFPTLTGYVPYTGATQNLDLGTYGLISDYLQLNTAPTSVPTTAGTMSWNNTDGTMDIKLKGGNVTLQVGEENVTRVVNKSGIDLLEANYQVVRIRNQAEGGAQGQRLAVVLARANTKINHTGILGIVTETINSNQEGFITNFGIVRDIDTTGDLQGETWLDGDALWLSETTAGALTNIEPTTHPLQIGYVTYAHANNGKIFVFLQEGIDELNELHDVSIVSAVNNQGLFYESATNLWKNKSISTVLGYTPANAATTLTINGTQYDLSADRSWSVGTVTSVAALTLGTTGTDLSSTVANGGTTPVITLNVPTASAANRGALSAADWATFNNKVTSVSASSPLASTGGSTPTVSIQQSSGSQDGYLSSTDWTTFNNKQASGNYITSLTGEATATGPGAASVTLVNASVTAKVLTGVNITGGTVLATDSILTAFGKLQNQINGLVGGSIYQGTWNASTNTPALASGVGTKGYYYIVSVAGSTNLDGITDWNIGDWAIFDGTAWQQVDNTDAVVSVNGQTGAVSLTTDNIPEGATNQYYLNSRARASLSFAAGSGAYNSTTGVITIPTNTNQLTNGASFITLASLSASSPLSYNNTTGAFAIQVATTSQNGYLSSTDWNTFNNKASTASLANYLPLAGGTLTGPLGGTSATFSGNIKGSNAIGAEANGSNIFGSGPRFYLYNAATTDGILWQLNASNNIDFWGVTSNTASTSPIISFSRTGVINANQYRINTNGTSAVYNIVNADQTYAGSYNLQAGAGSAGYGGSLVMYGHSHATKSGWVIAGISTSSAGKFSVQNAGNGQGSDIFTVDQAGAVVAQSTIYAYNNITADATNPTFIANASSSTYYGGLSIRENGTERFRYAANSDEGGYIYRSSWGGFSILSDAATYLRIPTSGNVLINTRTDNGAKFQVNGSATFSSSLVIGSSSPLFGSFSQLTVSGAQGGITIQASSTGISRLFFAKNDTSNAEGLIRYEHSDNSMQFWTSATQRMRITGDGRVGIGTDVPAYRFSVLGFGSGSGWSSWFQNNSSINTYLSHSDGYGIAVESIANNSTIYLMKLVGGDGSTIGTNERFKVTSNGVTYINTTGISGGGTLQVNGDVNINGNFKINGTTIGGGGGSGVTGSGTTNYITKWTGGSTLGNSIMVDNGSTVKFGSPGNLGGWMAAWFQEGIGVAPTGSQSSVYLYSDGSGLFGVNAYDYGAGAYKAVTIGWGGGRVRLAIDGGNVLVGTTTDNGYKLQINGSASFAYGFLSVYRGSSGANDILVGNDGNRIYIGGNTYVAGNVTATGGFFDTSDSRLKTLITDNFKAEGIEKVIAKLYLKNGIEELGYYAQDIQKILPSAVFEGSDGYLSLSYSQVHTAKIAVIEDEVTILKNRVTELETKLQKYDA